LGVLLDVIIAHEIVDSVDVLALEIFLVVALQGVAVFLLTHEVPTPLLGRHRLFHQEHGATEPGMTHPPKRDIFGVAFPVI